MVLKPIRTFASFDLLTFFAKTISLSTSSSLTNKLHQETHTLSKAQNLLEYFGGFDTVKWRFGC